MTDLPKHRLILSNTFSSSYIFFSLKVQFRQQSALENCTCSILLLDFHSFNLISRLSKPKSFKEIFREGCWVLTPQVFYRNEIIQLLLFTWSKNSRILHKSAKILTLLMWYVSNISDQPRNPVKQTKSHLGRFWVGRRWRGAAQPGSPGEGPGLQPENNIVALWFVIIIVLCAKG